MFPGWPSLTNYENHRLGRLWIVWKDNVRGTPIYKSPHLITCSILVEWRSDETNFTFVYASNLVEERKELWEELKTHHDSRMFQGKPWLICGDFNEILQLEEHSSYDQSKINPVGMRDFQEIVSYCEMSDLSFYGSKFTWSNKRTEGVINKKVDMVLVNIKWVTRNTQSYCVFKAGRCSDHSRCQIYIKKEEPRKKRPFNFTNALVSSPG